MCCSKITGIVFLGGKNRARTKQSWFQNNPISTTSPVFQPTTVHSSLAKCQASEGKSARRGKCENEHELNFFVKYKVQILTARETAGKRPLVT